MSIPWKNLILIIFIIFFSFGCVRTKTDSFLIARAGLKDTPEDLAQKHLGDRYKGWLIREVNEVEALSPGQQVVIPTGVFNPGGLRVDGAQSVPVLVYHGFSTSQSETRTIVSRQKFIEQLQYLKDNGYRVVTMDDFFDFLEFKKDLHPKSVVLTIDDGWCSLYEIAFPILKQYGYPVTLFLYADLVHENSCLSWEQVSEMQKSGFSVANHSKTHRDLSGPKGEETYSQYFMAVRDEIDQVELLIKEHLNYSPRYFAYPYGASSDLLVAYLKKKGYRGGFKISPGGNPFYIDKFQIKRSVIYGDYDIDSFADKLNIFISQKLQ